MQIKGKPKGKEQLHRFWLCGIPYRHAYFTSCGTGHVQVNNPEKRSLLCCDYLKDAIEVDKQFIMENRDSFQMSWFSAIFHISREFFFFWCCFWDGISLFCPGMSQIHGLKRFSHLSLLSGCYCRRGPPCLARYFVAIATWYLAKMKASQVSWNCVTWWFSPITELGFVKGNLL